MIVSDTKIYVLLLMQEKYLQEAKEIEDSQFSVSQREPAGKGTVVENASDIKVNNYKKNKLKYITNYHNSGNISSHYSMFVLSPHTCSPCVMWDKGVW